MKKPRSANHRIGGYFTDAERKKIQEKIKKTGYSQNQYVRYILLNISLDVKIIRNGD